MAKFEPDELLKKMRINKYAADMMIGAQPLPKDNPNKRIPVPSDQPLDSPYLPNKSPGPSIPDLASLTQKEMDSLNKIFPGAQDRINKFRKEQFDMGPMQIKPQGPQLPDLANFLVPSGTGNRISEDALNRGMETILNTTRPGSPEREKRMNILFRQFEDQVQNQLMIRPEQIAMSPADVPLGDGMINDAKTKMQINLKQKYDMMLENGMMSQEEYDKVMKRTMGTKKK